MINRKTDYALRCLMYLAQQPAGEWVTTAEISKKMRVSPAFLAKIFRALAERRVIESQKGKRGGVRLLKREASVGELLRLLEPRFAFNKCLAGGFRCFRQKECRLHTLLNSMQREFFARLNQVKLVSLAA